MKLYMCGYFGSFRSTETSRVHGSAPEEASQRQRSKYVNVEEQNYIFLPLAFEPLALGP